MKIRSIAVGAAAAAAAAAALAATLAPHPNAARLLMDFMLSDEAQAIYAGQGLIPVVAGLNNKLPPVLQPFGNAKVLGTSAWENEAMTYKAANEIYK